MMLLAGLHDPSFWVVAGASVIAGMLLLRSTRYYARQKQEPPPQGPQSSPAAPRSPADQSPALEHWEVRMHDTARDLSAQLDSKFCALQAMVAEADRAAARLEAALAKTDEPAPRMNQQARSLQQGEPPPREAPPAVGTAARPRRYEEIYTLADYGYEPAEIARRVNTPVGEVELILSLRSRG